MYEYECTSVDKMIDEKIRSWICQSSSESRRVLGDKWPISFIRPIKGSVIRNETLQGEPYDYPPLGQ